MRCILQSACILNKLEHFYERVSDEVAEWLRRWTANVMCCARVGSSLILVVLVFKCEGYTRVCKHPLQTGTFVTAHI